MTTCAISSSTTLSTVDTQVSLARAIAWRLLRSWTVPLWPLRALMFNLRVLYFLFHSRLKPQSGHSLRQRRRQRCSSGGNESSGAELSNGKHCVRLRWLTKAGASSQKDIHTMCRFSGFCTTEYGKSALCVYIFCLKSWGTSRIS